MGEKEKKLSLNFLLPSVFLLLDVGCLVFFSVKRQFYSITIECCGAGLFLETFSCCR